MPEDMNQQSLNDAAETGNVVRKMDEMSVIHRQIGQRTDLSIDCPGMGRR
jgi:hypothetical protein